MILFTNKTILFAQADFLEELCDEEMQGVRVPQPIVSVETDFMHALIMEPQCRDLMRF